ncbi:MAG: LD-carboxypeptidase, partial [Spirochaetota bacterium]|nr:LD-carboxypeptidase [Spirochaetota bacterium]
MLANRLRPGDKIAIVSPSNPVTENLLDQFNKGLRFLEDLGFAVIKGKHLFSDSLGYSARPEEKAEDINSLFSDNSVKGIICAQGGSNANSCLQELDWNTIRNNPKVFIGLSDITVILNTIFTKTGLITFHGSDIIWGFGREPSQYDKSEFVDRLMQGKIEKVTAIDDSQTVRKGKSEGKLLGGNLRGFLKLAGTPF